MLTSPPFTLTSNQTRSKQTKSSLKNHHTDPCPSFHPGQTPEQCAKREENNLTKESITQKEMLSHQTIRDLVLRSAANVVTHSINRVSPETQLYRIGVESEKRQKSKTNFGSVERIHEKNDHFLKKVYKELKDETPAWKKVQDSFQAKNRKLTVPPNPPNGHQVSHSRNISISGLTTYNFRSVKARYRLAYDTRGTDEQVSRSIASSKKRAFCSIQRTQKIHLKTCPNEANAHRSLSQIITHNYPQTTQDYLQAYESEKEKGELIYGLPCRDYAHASRMMDEEGMDQETAAFSISEIKLACRPALGGKLPPKVVQMQRRRGKGNGDREFEGRRYPVKLCRVIVSNIAME